MKRDIKNLNVKLISSESSGLIMHNSRAANPLDPVIKQIKAISNKRKKSDADLYELSRLEFLASLYVTDNGIIGLPGNLIEGALLTAAKTKRNGKLFKAGCFCEGMFPLIYEGPSDPEKLWECEDFRFLTLVNVQQSKILRTRAIFKKWEADVSINYFEDILNKQDIIDTLEYAGVFCGIGDWRPKFGRFNVEVIS